MKHLYLLRNETGDHGTFGRLFFPDMGKLKYYTLEPPDKNNLPNRSCILNETYLCVWHYSPKYGWVYKVTNVKNRTSILIHWGCFGGDTTLGYISNTLGCLLFGMRKGVLGKQRVILSTRKAIRQFNREMNKESFLLTIINLY